MDAGQGNGTTGVNFPRSLPRYAPGTVQGERSQAVPFMEIGRVFSECWPIEPAYRIRAAFVDVAGHRGNCVADCMRESGEPDVCPCECAGAGDCSAARVGRVAYTSAAAIDDGESSCGGDWRSFRSVARAGSNSRFDVFSDDTWRTSLTGCQSRLASARIQRIGGGNHLPLLRTRAGDARDGDAADCGNEGRSSRSDRWTRAA